MNKCNLIYDFDNFSEILYTDTIFINRFEIINVIKQHTQKIVCIAYDKKYNKKCVLKVKYMECINDTEINVYNKIKEIVEMYPNIYIERIYNIIQSPLLLYIICEFIQGVTLDIEFNNNKPNKEQLYNIMIDLFNTINIIHSHDIIHGDIKLNNIVIDKQKHVHLIDFDMATIANNDICRTNSNIGTENYIAPESFDLCIYSKKSDIWSLGILLFKLITGQFPYDNPLNQYKHIYLRNNFKNLKLYLLNECKSMYSSEIILMIIQMLEFRGTDRPSINTLIKKFESINHTTIQLI